VQPGEVEEGHPQASRRRGHAERGEASSPAASAARRASVKSS
jgi:hypothetical protein